MVGAADQRPGFDVGEARGEILLVTVVKSLQEPVELEHLTVMGSPMDESVANSPFLEMVPIPHRRPAL